MEKYLDVKPKDGKEFYLKYQQKGKVVMLNLLKFKSKADYTNLEDLKPEDEISGSEAYQLYMDSTIPQLKKVGSRVIIFGDCNNFLIGPETEKWDAVLLVEHESSEKFIKFARNEDYLKIVGHRTAALEDSRLLPFTASKGSIA